MPKLLLTGGCGFIGSHCVEGLLKDTDWEIVIIDRLDVSGNLKRLTSIRDWENQKTRVKFIWWDLKSELNEQVKKEIGEVDYIWHLAASSHVDRSIADPMSFVMDNVVGTTHMLNFARTLPNLKLFINFGTDEVFGPSINDYGHKELDAHRPSNPYSASKAGAIDMGYAFYKTYQLPIITTHTANCFGEKQFSEKLIPKCIRMVQQQKPMPIFAALQDGQMKAVGSRFWIHAREVCNALLFLTNKGRIGEFYNITGVEALTNMELCEMIANIIGKPLITDFVDSNVIRPGHDLQYIIDGTKLKEMGWSPKLSIKESLAETVNWTINNPEWL